VFLTGLHRGGAHHRRAVAAAHQRHAALALD
jgi:hypothetical protein